MKITLHAVVIGAAAAAGTAAFALGGATDASVALAGIAAVAVVAGDTLRDLLRPGPVESDWTWVAIGGLYAAMVPADYLRHGPGVALQVAFLALMIIGYARMSRRARTAEQRLATIEGGTQ